MHPLRYTFKDIRRAYKPRNSWWGFFVIHPLASFLVYLLANYTTVRPEVICLASFLVGISAVPFFLEGSTAGLFWGGWIVFMSNILDATDGKLARLTGNVSVLGAYLDTILDIIKHSLLLISLIIREYMQQDQNPVILYAGLVFLGILLFNYVNENLLGRLKLTLIDESVSPKNTVNFWNQWFYKKKLLPFPCGVELLTLMFIIGPITNHLFSSLWLGSVGFLFYSMTYTIRTLKKTCFLTRAF